MPVPICFENFLAVRTPCLPAANAPTSGFYINQIPGISLEHAGDLHSKEQISAFRFLQTVIDNSVQTLVEQMATELNKNLRFKSVLELDSVGEWAADYLVTTAGRKQGARFCRTKSRLTETYIRQITFRCNNNITDKIYIDDGSGNAPDEYAFTSLIGVPVTVQINKAFVSEEIFIYTEADVILANDSQLFTESDCGTCGGSPLRTGSDYGFIKIDGQTDDTGIIVNGLTQTFGLNVDFSVNCSREQAACAMKRELRLAILYNAGVQYALEWQLNDRINAASMLNQDSAIKLQKYCEGIRDKELETFRRTAAPSLRKLDAHCADCRGAITVTSYL